MESTARLCIGFTCLITVLPAFSSRREVLESYVIVGVFPAVPDNSIDALDEKMPSFGEVSFLKSSWINIVRNRSQPLLGGQARGWDAAEDLGT